MQSEVERLQGIYRAQLSARLGRLLENVQIHHAYRCTLRIDQSPSGAIIDLSAEHCSEDDRNKQRLLAAVWQASPLPAPPRTDIFRSKLIVDLGAKASVRW